MLIATFSLPSLPHGHAQEIMIDDQVLEANRIKPLRAEPDVSSPRAAFGNGAYQTQLWPGGILPVSFSEGFSDDAKRFFFSVCLEWEQRSGVRCVEHTDQPIALRLIADDNLCYSTVGYQQDPRMSLGNGCWHRGVILHELGHAFGLMHEHQRENRDNYITIHWENVREEHLAAYSLIAPDSSSDYDFESIMHYAQETFAKRWALAFSLKPKFKRYEERVGRQSGLSNLDGRHMAAIYRDLL